MAAESMLGVAFEGGTPGPAEGWRDRWRSATWLGAHLVAGAALALVITVLPVLVVEVHWLMAPVALATALAVGVLLVVVLRGLAPRLLGPSAHERIALLEREATELGERNRLAREIHDSVGHSLSLLTVQAAAARRVQADDPAFVAEALVAIEEAGRRATAELDHVLGLLRAEAGPRSPAPDLRGLTDLVAAANRAGLAVTLESLPDDQIAMLSPVSSRELYRVAQEGLSNALRHGSGPGQVLLARTEQKIRLDITNAVSGPAREGRRGRGVRGIEERARALGGTATAGPMGGGWRVHVEMPWVTAR